MQSVSPLPLLALSLLVLSAGASAASLRRPHTGFLGMRGKRSAPAPTELQLPSVTLRQPLPGQLPSPQQLLQLFRAAGPYSRQLAARIADKRAPSGFAGMRGRKREELGARGSEDHLEKRVPSGFGGMRGKKADVVEGGEHKRAPQNSFLGLRGRREEQGHP
ncbi:Tachykinin [Amphibalanus amphitrite]|uniref:Tachykinin n=1 Tax=Amphibalanus amphitrite TaxID=1232801 RepID=I3VNA6_AMPAM|nr:tachykinins-like [Amphibalanus amphitrite]AFK81943.1 tachykinin-related peptide [Amphibalanus amphitrite]KAF0291756.1 Tachykinin [Amphibalanus amphitrite]